MPALTTIFKIESSSVWDKVFLSSVIIIIGNISNSQMNDFSNLLPLGGKIVKAGEFCHFRQLITSGEQGAASLRD
jgi:hypothetical protein